MATTKNRSAIGTTTKARVRTVLFQLTGFMGMSKDGIIFLRNTASVNLQPREESRRAGRGKEAIYRHVVRLPPATEEEGTHHGRNASDE
jgi:hypothetical protein